VHVGKGASAANVAGFAQHLRNHNGAADDITSVAIDMSKAFIKGATENLPKAVITFDKFHVVAHASQAVDKMRRIEQKTDPALKGLAQERERNRARSAAVLLGFKQNGMRICSRSPLCPLHVDA
jgi:transposase